MTADLRLGLFDVVGNPGTTISLTLTFYDRLVKVEAGGEKRDERPQRIEQALGVSGEEN